MQKDDFERRAFYATLLAALFFAGILLNAGLRRMKRRARPKSTPGNPAVPREEETPWLSAPKLFRPGTAPAESNLPPSGVPAPRIVDNYSKPPRVAPRRRTRR